MQIWHPLTRQQIDISTADRLVSIFRNNGGTPLSTLQCNTATLKYVSTFRRIQHMYKGLFIIYGWGERCLEGGG